MRRAGKAEIVGGARHADLVHTPTQLDDSGTGCWLIRTQTSAHLVDLDSRTVTRIDGAGTPNSDAGWTVSALRKDRDPVQLLRVLRCSLGYPMELLLRVRDNGVTTLRRTTSVVAITPAAGWSPHAARP